MARGSLYWVTMVLRWSFRLCRWPISIETNTSPSKVLLPCTRSATSGRFLRSDRERRASEDRRLEFAERVLDRSDPAIADCICS